MENQVNVISKKVEVLVMTNLTADKEYARVYFEPSNRYSEGGGTLTISIPDRDWIGQHFFSHVSQSSFKEFVTQCNSPYLIAKLFKDLAKPSLPVEDSEELFDWVRREGMYKLKEARQSGVVSKTDLRHLYEELGGRSFNGLSHLSDLIGRKSFATMSSIYGGDWYFEARFDKPNDEYIRLKSIVDAVLNQLKLMVEVAQA